MEIANLLKQKSTIPAPEVFLAVQIQEGLVKTAFWQITDGIPTIISFGTLQIYTDVDALPEAVDVSLTHALANLESEPNRVLFGLPESWIRDNTLAPENKDAVLQVCKQLDLKPVGFVSITDAVITFLKEKEGIPPSVILTEIGDTKVNVAVVRLGVVKGREEVERSDDIAADVAEGLARINTDQLPSRFLVINGNDSEVEQQLVSYSWIDKFPFLHLPKVEIPDPHFSVEAIALAGGSEAARSMGFEVEESHSDSPSTAKEGGPDDSEERGLNDIENVVPIEGGLPIRDSGFSDPEPDQQINRLTDEHQVEGFVTDADIENLQEPSFAVNPAETPTPTFVKASKFKLPKFSLPKFGFSMPSLPGINLTRFRSRPKTLILVPIILLFLVIVSYVLILFVFNSAQIQVQVDPYSLSKSLPITINNQSDANSLSATPQTFSIDKSGSIPTTGQATVGDEAIGEVLILNKTNVPKTFAKGTVLSGPNSLKFTLDSEVNIASSSSVTNPDSSILITPGKATAAITATKFGTDYNLGGGTTLTLATFLSSQYEAKVNNGLTGGTSRSVRAVSTDDQKNLLTNVLDQVKQDASSKVSSTSDMQAVPTADTKITKQEFNAKVGEEADNLTLSISATITVLQYRPSDLQNLVSKQLSGSIPPGYAFNPASMTVSVKDTNTSGATITATAQADAKLLPELDLAQYGNQIKGKSVAASRQLFENISGYRGVNFKIKFNLPFIADRLPYNPAKIDISILPTE